MSCLLLSFLVLTASADENSGGGKDELNNKAVPQNKSLVPALKEGEYQYVEQMREVAGDGKDGSVTAIGKAAYKLTKNKVYESIYAITTALHNEFQTSYDGKGFGLGQEKLVESLIKEAKKMIASQSKHRLTGNESKPEIEKLEAELDYQKNRLTELVDVMLVLAIEQHTDLQYFKETYKDLNKLKSLVNELKIPFPKVAGNVLDMIQRESDALRPYVTDNFILEAQAKLESMNYQDVGLSKAREREAIFRNRLERNVIEQPEAIEEILNIERIKYLYAERINPEILVLMGLPGTGKDTIAEAWVKAMHPADKNALENHMYRVQVLRNKADSWSELGSATGYKGSGEFPKFLEFLINHSGGRYRKVAVATKDGEEKWKIEQNPNWEGKNLPGKKGPQDAVVFLNEFHDWSYMMKNEFAKEFLEKGIVTVNNPNGGVKKLFVPINIVVASNDGIDLIADRHLDGRPRGRAQAYKQLFANWFGVHKDRRLLKSTFMRTPEGSGTGEDRKGTSEEVASRLYNFILLRPLSPEGLVKIADIHLNSLKEKLATINERVGKINLSWTKKVSKYIQEYLFDAEENARPIKEKVKSLVEKTIVEAIFRGDITEGGKEVDLEISINENKNGTADLELEVKQDGKSRKFRDKIKRTEEIKFVDPLSPEKIQETLDLEKRINERVFGVSHIAKQLAKNILNSKIRNNGNELRNKDLEFKAMKYAFMGLSSTGKTELTKVLGEEIFGRKVGVWNVDMNSMQSQHDWEKTFGFDFENANQRSEFQKEYDRNGGKLIIVLDELANVRDKNLLKMLYPYFDEREVAERSMKNVIFLVTGNAGEEWYQGIPKDQPEIIRHFSMLEIYKKAIAQTGKNESLLLNYFPEALLKRISMDNVFFFPPFNFENIRRMVKLKLNKLFETVYSPKKETHWWNVYFKDRETVERTLTIIEKEGFTLDGQGRSVEKFIEERFASELNEFLIKNQVPIGQKVELSLNHDLIKTNLEDRVNEAGVHKKGLYLDVKTGNGVNGTIFIKGKAYKKYAGQSDVSQMMVAYHEAGHELVRKVYMSDISVSEGISVVPGVTHNGMRWIVYLGIAKSEDVRRMDFTEDAMLMRIAVLYGGFMAEMLASKGNRHNEGKSNDIDMASNIIKRSILEWGLSEAWGVESMGRGTNVNEYLAAQTEERRQLFQSEFRRMEAKAKRFAKEAILANWSTFVDLGFTLGEKGDMSKEDVAKVYERNSDFRTHAEAADKEEYISRALKIRKGHYTRTEEGEVVFGRQYLKRGIASITSYIGNKFSDTYEVRDAELIHESLMPEKPMRIEDLLEERMEEARQKVSADDIRTEPVGKKSKKNVKNACSKAFQ